MHYFLGFDVGSSKTHALVADETGKCIGFGRAWGGNHQVVGYEGLADVLRAAFEEASRAPGVRTNLVAGAAFGISGYDFPSDREPHLQTIDALGLSCPVEIVNDGVNGLISGTSHGIGINVTAGSSNNCRGRGWSGREGRIVGNGPMFGEFGGGMEIVLKALHMVNYAWIHRTPPTALTRVLLEATGASDEMDLMEGLSSQTYHLFPHFAPAVVAAARQGDPAAREVVRWAGEELGWLAVSVARQIEMEDEEVEIVQSGSIFEAGPLILNPMRKVILKHVPKARLLRLEGPPVVGPLMLGMQLAGIDPYPVRAKLITTASAIVP